MAEKTRTVRGITLGEGLPKICVPVTAANLQELKEQVRRILQSPCDMVEWRADFYEKAEEGAQLTEALAYLRRELKEIPLLFTFRTKEEGGERSLPLEKYERLNLDAADTGMIDLADIELNRGEALLCRMTEQLHERGVLVISSFHDFARTPEREEITAILRRMQSCGVDITKAAVMPQTEGDVLTLLAASLQMKRSYGDRPYITMSMGALGGVSRLAGSLTGSSVTFATAGKASAPGQMEAGTVARLLPALQFGDGGR